MTIWYDGVLYCIAIVKCIIFCYVILLNLQKICVKMIIPIRSLDFHPLCASYIVQTLLVPVSFILGINIILTSLKIRIFAQFYSDV